jgi:hypothetical protein
MIHLLGISRGHDGSTVNVGTPPLAALTVVVSLSSPDAHDARKGVTTNTRPSVKILGDLCIVHCSVRDFVA